MRRGSAKTGYLGPEGSWTEEAARLMSPGSDLVGFDGICRIIDEVASKGVSFGVLPVENSIGGGVVDSLDCLSEVEGVYIVSEKIMSIDHVLMGSGDLGEVKRVVSHRNAISQCRKTLGRVLPGAPLEFSQSTSRAAMDASTDSSTAVIGSRRLAGLYGLNVLAEKISDHERNFTRFVMIGRTEAERTGKDRTSLCVTLKKNESASLWRFLGIFAAVGINLSRVESRPDPESPGEYRFFLDMFGHRADSALKTALKATGDYCSSLKYLGSYPREDWPRSPH